MKANEKNYFSDGTGDWFFIHFLYLLPSSHAQGDVEKKFMKQHQKEMETFMTKCSGCHSLQRIFAKKRTKGGVGQDLETDGGKTPCHYQ